MPDIYTRTRALLGTQALETLRAAHVAVFGIGGVGGQAVEVLARSGVGELSLFDSDTVAESNLNRQLIALQSTLGQYKVDAMAVRIADIDPTTVVHANRLFYNADTADAIDMAQFDYVLDNRFSFGELQLHMNLRDAKIREVKVYSDSLNVSICDRLEPALIGVRFDAQTIAEALSSIGANEASEIADYILERGL